VEANGNSNVSSEMEQSNRDEKIVLFLGRITMQKRPGLFPAGRQEVLEKDGQREIRNGRFGDMMHARSEMAAGLGIGARSWFTGFLRG